MGFKSQFTMAWCEDESLALFQVEKGVGLNKKCKFEGVRLHNFLRHLPAGAPAHRQPALYQVPPPVHGRAGADAGLPGRRPVRLRRPAEGFSEQDLTEGKVFGLLAWRRVPAQGSVAGLAVKIPLGFARRDFMCRFTSVWSVGAIENPGAFLSGGILLACGANRPTPYPLPCSYQAKEDGLPAREGEIVI